MKTRSLIKLLCMSAVFFVSCTAKVYVQDRHTIMEDEAAGEWPQFEKEILTRSVGQGPTPFEKTGINAQKKKLYNVLNGEMVSSTENSSETKKKD